MPPAAPPQSAGQPSGDPAPVEEPRRRLHPLSPLLHGAKSLTVIVAALSWQTLSQVGLERFAIVVAVAALGVVVFSVVGWLNTGYHVVGRELRIADGLLWRRNRAIPLERLQAVELRRPLLAQLTGLAELRLEVVGGGKTEAPLAYLTVRDAAVLRERLLSLAGRAPALAAAPDRPVAAVERPLVAGDNTDLIVSQLLTPQALLLPIGITGVTMQFVLEGTWTFVGIASTITAMVGVLLQPVRRILRDWAFRLARDADGRLAVRHGLVETRSQVVPLHRVQSVSATWPLLWRAKGWLHLRLDVAGFAGPQERDDNRSDRLLPVGDLDTARAVVWEVLPGVDLLALPVTAPPARARWLHPFALRYLGAGLAPAGFVTRWGRLTHELQIVPYARLQSIRVVQGPVQRLLGLATVYADTAGGRGAAARDRDLREAWVLAAQLAERGRHAMIAATVPDGSPAALGGSGDIADRGHDPAVRP
ncbi:PH domain-containing protein [Krasilnikovia sp. M28-CT-15]|uniref:PH domain-containing protein n=1 Tax=Krasilnikovia sp. M28-CT-15 TaxID=3373540 RepID=UPI00399D0871